MHLPMNRTAVLYALLSAVLFGVSTPVAKFLIGSINPVTLAGLLYCGAGVGLAILRSILPSIVTGAPEVAVSRAELPWLAGAIGAGGIVGPLLLMFGSPEQTQPLPRSYLRSKAPRRP
jgi:drug/metabolite transporter (DMT)-like permease